MKTIFDIGMHEARDSEFYLRKGFRVVAVEANPRFLPAVRQRLQSFLDSGQFVIVNKVIAREGGRSVPFYVRPDKDGWSSIYREYIEGADEIVAEQIAAQPRKPAYASFEVRGEDDRILGILARAGYDRFQLVYLRRHGAASL